MVLGIGRMGGSKASERDSERRSFVIAKELQGCGGRWAGGGGGGDREGTPLRQRASSNLLQLPGKCLSLMAPCTVYYHHLSATLATIDFARCT